MSAADLCALFVCVIIAWPIYKYADMDRRWRYHRYIQNEIRKGRL